MASLLTGPVADRSALLGLLARIRDLGLPLLSVRRVGHGEMSDELGVAKSDRAPAKMDGREMEAMGI